MRKHFTKRILVTQAQRRDDPGIIEYNQLESCSRILEKHGGNLMTNKGTNTERLGRSSKYDTIKKKKPGFWKILTYTIHGLKGESKCPECGEWVKITKLKTWAGMCRTCYDNKMLRRIK